MTVAALNPDPPDVIVRVMLTFDRAADDYLGDCARRGFTPRTLATYRRTYHELANRLPDDQDVSKVTTDTLRRYLASKTHLAPGSVAGCESHLASLFKSLLMEGKIARDPMALLVRTRRRSPEDLDVTTVSSDDVRRLLAACNTWPERLAFGILCYLGPRRHAVALLRLRDYDRLHGRLRFREKGGKTIWKPIPDELRNLLEAAIAAGAIREAPDDYLVPPEGFLQKRGERDDRVIWRLVKKVSARAGVDCHVHALRAAFAVFYLEQNTGDLEGLREHMGHRKLSTTQVYLRKLDRDSAMERVRSLSWGTQDSSSEGAVDPGREEGPCSPTPGIGELDAQQPQMRAPTVAATAMAAGAPADPEPGLAPNATVVEIGNLRSDSTPQIAAEPYAASPVVGAGGFEPPYADFPVAEPDAAYDLLEALAIRRNHAAPTWLRWSV